MSNASTLAAHTKPRLAVCAFAHWRGDAHARCGSPHRSRAHDRFFISGGLFGNLARFMPVPSQREDLQKEVW